VADRIRASESLLRMGIGADGWPGQGDSQLLRDADHFLALDLGRKAAASYLVLLVENGLRLDLRSLALRWGLRCRDGQVTESGGGALGPSLSSPELSVVLVVGALRSRAEECLRSVLRDEASHRVEVLVMDLAPANTPPLVAANHPSVRIVAVSPGTTYASARAEGVRRARAPVVACLEEHCRTKPGWIEAVLAAHSGQWAGVGGEVHNGNPRAAMSATIALMNYAPWLPPGRRDEDAAHLPGHNSSFLRDRLLAFGPELDLLLVSDINLHRRLRLAGERLLLDPAVRFEHINETGFGSLARGYYLWHRLYGWSRSQVFRWPLRRRLLYVAAAPAIPFYFLIRQYREIRRLRPDLIPAFVRGLPLIWAAQTVSAFGQAVGLLFGAGDTASRFTHFELNEPRPTGLAPSTTASTS